MCDDIGPAGMHEDGMHEDDKVCTALRFEKSVGCCMYLVWVLDHKPENHVPINSLDFRSFRFASMALLHEPRSLSNVRSQTLRKIAQASLNGQPRSLRWATNRVRAAQGAVCYIKPVQTGFPHDSDAALVAAVCGGSPTAGAHAAALLGTPAGSTLAPRLSPERWLQEHGVQGQAVHASTLFAWSEAVGPHVAMEREGRAVADDSVVAATLALLRQHSGLVEREGLRPGLALVETAGGVCSPSASGRLQVCGMLFSVRCSRCVRLSCGTSTVSSVRCYHCVLSCSMYVVYFERVVQGCNPDIMPPSMLKWHAAILVSTGTELSAHFWGPSPEQPTHSASVITNH